MQDLSMPQCLKLKNLLMSCYGPIGLHKTVIDDTNQANFSNSFDVVLNVLHAKGSVVHLALKSAQVLNGKCNDGCKCFLLMVLDGLFHLKSSSDNVLSLAQNAALADTLVLLQSFYIDKLYKEAERLLRMDVAQEKSDCLRKVLQGLAFTHLSNKAGWGTVIRFAHLVSDLVASSLAAAEPRLWPQVIFHLARSPPVMWAPGQAASLSELLPGVLLPHPVLAHVGTGSLKRCNFVVFNGGFEGSGPYGVSQPEGTGDGYGIRIGSGKEYAVLLDSAEEQLRVIFAGLIAAGVTLVLTTGRVCEAASSLAAQHGVWLVGCVEEDDARRLCRAAAVYQMHVSDLPELRVGNYVGEAAAVSLVAMGRHRGVLVELEKHKAHTFLVRAPSEALCRQHSRLVKRAIKALTAAFTRPEHVPAHRHGDLSKPTPISEMEQAGKSGELEADEHPRNDKAAAAVPGESSRSSDESIGLHIVPGGCAVWCMLLVILEEELVKAQAGAKPWLDGLAPGDRLALERLPHRQCVAALRLATVMAAAPIRALAGKEQYLEMMAQIRTSLRSSAYNTSAGAAASRTPLTPSTRITGVTFPGLSAKAAMRLDTSILDRIRYSSRSDQLNDSYSNARAPGSHSVIRTALATCVGPEDMRSTSPIIGYPMTANDEKNRKKKYSESLQGGGSIAAGIDLECSSIAEHIVDLTGALAGKVEPPSCRAEGGHLECSSRADNATVFSEGSAAKPADDSETASSSEVKHSLAIDAVSAIREGSARKLKKDNATHGGSELECSSTTHATTIGEGSARKLDSGIARDGGSEPECSSTADDATTIREGSARKLDKGTADGSNPESSSGGYYRSRWRPCVGDPWEHGIMEPASTVATVWCQAVSTLVTMLRIDKVHHISSSRNGSSGLVVVQGGKASRLGRLRKGGPANASVTSGSDNDDSSGSDSCD